jgi:hypothetical protein
VPQDGWPTQARFRLNFPIEPLRSFHAGGSSLTYFLECLAHRAEPNLTLGGITEAVPFPFTLKVRLHRLSGQGTADLPVQAERVHQASQSPAVLLAYREDLGRARRQRLRENCIRVGDGQDHSDRVAPERLRA